MSTTPKAPGSPEGAVKIEAKSLEQALVKAAGALGVTQDEVGYQVLKEETAKGLFSFFKNPVVEISAWVKAKAPEGRPQRGQRSQRPARDHGDGRGREHRESRDSRDHERSSRPAPQRATRPPRHTEDDDTDEAIAKAEPLSPEKVESLQAELREFCAGIVSRIAGEPVNVTSSISEGRLVLDIESEYFAQQINKNSKLAEAMEHILRKKPRHLRQELPFRIFVDVSGVRRKREEDLIQMAHDLSAKVHENKRPIVLNYKSSYDRKIIHMALDKDERVYTKSIGSGPNRKLMILPSRDGGTHLPETEITPEG
jgi:spoIIIJ-associated protein